MGRRPSRELRVPGSNLGGYFFCMSSNQPTWSFCQTRVMGGNTQEGDGNAGNHVYRGQALGVLPGQTPGRSRDQHGAQEGLSRKRRCKWIAFINIPRLAD